MSDPTSALKEAVKNATAEERVILRQELRQMIDHIANRIHYAEQRMQKISFTGSAFVAAGVAILPMWLNITEETVLKFPMIALCIGLIVCGFSILFAYARQTNYSYPFKGHTNTWKWFYRDALKSASDFDVKPWQYFYHTGNTHSQEQDIYDDNFKAFNVEIAPRILDVEEHFSQDLEQIFVLHVNERYKNLFLSHLRKVKETGIILTGIFVIIAFVFALFVACA